MLGTNYFFQEHQPFDLKKNKLNTKGFAVIIIIIFNNDFFKNLFRLKKKINSGMAKDIHLAKWNGQSLVYSIPNRQNPDRKIDFKASFLQQNLRCTIFRSCDHYQQYLINLATYQVFCITSSVSSLAARYRV